MNKNALLGLLFTVLLASCSPKPVENSGNSLGGSISSSLSSRENTTNTSATSEEKKKTVAAHTLKDSNPPIDVESIGQVVDEDTWDSFRYASEAQFAKNYNYTYRAYSGGYQTIEKFTKNGYYTESIGGKLYYERKNGSTFYNYVSTNEGYLRQETAFGQIYL